MRSVIFGLLPPLCLLFVLPARLEARWQDVFVPLDSPAQLADLAELGIDLDPCGMVWENGGLHLPLQESQVGDLVRAGYLPRVLEADLEELYSSRMGASRDFGAYYTVAESYAEIAQIHSDFPGLVSLPDTIGYSLEGNPILAVKISDNVNVDEDEPELLYTARIHAREAITVSVLLDLMHHLTDNYGTDQRITDLVNNREFWFVPEANPDGVLYNEAIAPSGGGMWRKNRRNNGDGSMGVDLNRNFGFMWGFDDAGSSPVGNSETYRGTSGFSEPATQVLRDFVNSRHFQLALNYHSYSNLYLYPWDFETAYPPLADHQFFNDLASHMSEHNGYSIGTAWELLYPVNGGSSDWFYGDTLSHDKCFSLVPEVGSAADGFWPAESRIPELLNASLEPNLRLAELAEDCDGSGLPDALEARMGLLEDCNGNGIADVCEIADGLAVDCDGNGVPDECEAQYCDGLILFDDFEQASGWTGGVPGDDATTGQWIRVNPNGSTAQTEDDHSPAGSFCFVTGQAAPGAGQGTADVDGGYTTLLSPLYDLSAAVDPWCEYWRWYKNDSGDNANADVMTVELSFNDGSDWLPVETVGPGGAESNGGWFSHRFSIAALGTPSASMRFRFIASDLDGGSIVEAAMDDFALFNPGGCTDDTPMPTTVQIAVQGFDILLQWDAVVESLAGCPLAGVNYQLEQRLANGLWSNLGQTADLGWTITNALPATEPGIFRVIVMNP